MQGIAAGERPAAKSLKLTADLELAAAEAEDKFLNTLTGVYARAIREAGAAAASQFALTAAADWQPPAEGAALTAARLAAIGDRLTRLAWPVWRQIVLAVGKEPLARIGISWTVKHPLFAGQIQKAALRTGQRLGEAVQPVIRNTIAAAYEAGHSVRETTALITAAVNEAAPWQAEMLARSDLNSLANGASSAAAKLTGMQFKTWVATLDEKTRPEHAQAHGQTVAINDTFAVGGEDALYPGDPNLSDAMAANCRCTLAYGETLDEANALLADGGITMSKMTQRQRAKRKTRLAAQRRVAEKPTEALVAGAVAVHHTAVVTGTWDGNAAMGRCSSEADFRSICAAYESGADLSLRGSWHLPHHANPNGPANINGVRNGLGRAPQTTSISPADRAGASAHLRAHLNDFNRRQGSNAIADFDGMTDQQALAAMDEVWGPAELAESVHVPKALSLVAAARPVGFNGTAAIEGKISDDNSIAPRVLLPNSLSWPEMPVPFMAQTVTAEGHSGAEVAGRVDEFARKRGKGKMQDIAFSGELTTPFGIDEIAPMIEDKTLRYVSADLGASRWELVDRKTLDVVPQEEFDLEKAQEGAYALGLAEGKLKAVTLVPTQAIEGAMVALTASADNGGIGIGEIEDGVYRVVLPIDDIALTVGTALVAAAAPKRPPQEWFLTPEPPGKMPLTIAENGRVFGHLATWDSCHMGFLPSCVPPPRSDSNYAYFHVCELDTEEGGTVTVGKLMFSPGDGGHPDRGLSAQKASAYYDRTGMTAAYLHVIDGNHGIWAAGALNPDLNDEQRQEMRRLLRLHPPSGDWRPVNGQYELICALAVAVPGFATPRATVTITASGDTIQVEEAIIASSGLFAPDAEAVAALEEIGLIDEDLQAEQQMAELVSRVGWRDKLAEILEED